MQSKIEHLAGGCLSRVRRLEVILEQLEKEIQIDPDMLASVEILLSDLKNFENLFHRLKVKYHTEHTPPPESPEFTQFRQIVKVVNANPTNDVVQFVQQITQLSFADSFRVANYCVTDQPLGQYEDAIRTTISTSPFEPKRLVESLHLDLPI